MASLIPKHSGIYAIVNSINGRQYIGSAVNLRRRKYEHFSKLRKNKHHAKALQMSWNKRGEDCFLFEVLELVPAPLLLEREQAWIDRLMPYYSVAMVARAPMTGRKHSPETIERMRAKALADGRGSNSTGREVHIETRKRISESNTKYDHELMKSMFSDGSSIGDIALSIGCHKDTVRLVVSGRSKLDRSIYGQERKSAEARQ